MKGGERRELVGSDSIVKHGEGGGLGKDGWREVCDCCVIIHSQVQDGMTGEGIGFVGGAWEVNEDVVVVCKVGNVAGELDG